jgi:adenosylmethionine-8-amino-7-oxononanoate aminotransferase
MRNGLVQSFFAPAKRPRVVRAEGIWFIDSEGRRYLDASSGPVACNLGHGNPRVLDAMARQARELAFAFPTQFETDANSKLGERLAELCGPGLDRAFLVSGGSEAIETAIKFLRQHAVAIGQRNRWKVIALEPSYHGNTLGALAISGDPVAREVFAPLLTQQLHIPAPLTYRVPENHTQESWARQCAAALENTIRREGPETVLAFVIEPVGGTSSGANVPHDLYHAAVREICTRYGIALVHDEVMCGAGRTGRFLASEHWAGARPDLVVLAKGVTAGYTPMGVVMASAEMVETVAKAGGFAHTFTYFANPIACAVGLAVLDEVIGGDLIGNAARMGVLLRDGLQQLASECAIIGDIRGRGLLLAVELVADKDSRRALPTALKAVDRFQAIALDHGLAIYARRTAGGRWGEWLMVSPPLTVTPDEVTELLSRLRGAVFAFEAELRASGVWPT